MAELEVLDELSKEEQAKKKKRKPVFELRKEKRLQYYSGWSRSILDSESKGKKYQKLWEVGIKQKEIKL